MKIGNCGSPIETEAGWLVITHGVGPMRKYCIGAMLLDLHDPTKVLGRARGAAARAGRQRARRLRAERRLYLRRAAAPRPPDPPYGMSDTVATIVTLEIEELLAALKG